MAIGDCKDCGENYPFSKMVILANRVWLYIADTEDSLCSDCIEKRLGRKINKKDFPNKKVQVYRGQRINLRTIPINQLFFKNRGWRFPMNLNKKAKYLIEMIGE